MKKLIIEKIEGYKYFLTNNKENYEITIEFYDLLKTPREGDCLYINEKILNERILCFGSTDSEYGRNIQSSDDEDLLILDNNKEKIYLKRLYG